MSSIVRKTAFSALLVLPCLSPLCAQITEYTVPFNGLSGIAAGPDGALWFSGDRNIGRITTSGAVTAYPVPTGNDTSYAIAAGPDGAMWFTETALNSGNPFAKIGRISMAGAITEYTLPDPNSIPSAIAAGPDGALWFIESGNGKIGRITTSGTITEISLPATLSNYGVFAIASGPDGALWFAVDYGADAILRMTTSGTFTSYPVKQFANAGSTGITAGPDGALWFADENTAIGRITTSGAITEFPLTTPGDSPFAIAAGPDGALWYTSYIGGIGRVTTSGTATGPVLTPSNTAGGYLGAIAAGSDGAMWFTELGAKIGRIPTAASGPPSITLVANAEGEVPTIAPNTWVEIKGLDLAPPGDSRPWQGSDFVNAQLPTQLDGVSVSVNGKPAFVYYISPTQVNILTPPDALSGSVAVTVNNNGAATAAFMVQAQAESPSFFVFNGGPYVAAEHANGSFIGPPSLYPGYTTPAHASEEIMIYANGFGPTSTAVVSGAETQSGTLTPLPVIKIGGVQASVAFAGLIAPGEFQFNVIIPPSVTSGDQNITATYNGLTTQAGAMITVQ